MDDNVQKRGELDLPLSSNFSDIQVHHYLINLKCDLCNNFFQGSTSVYFTTQRKRDRLPDPLDIDSGISENTRPKSADSDKTPLEEKEELKSKSFVAELSSETEPVNNYIKIVDEKCRVICDVEKTSMKRKVNDTENSAAVLPMNKHLKQSVSLKDDTNISSDANLQRFDCEKENNKDFILILDCHELEIQSVSETEVTTSIDAQTLSSPHWSTDVGQTSENSLRYDLGDQCLKIKVPCQKDYEDNLRAIKISYKTTTDGLSLKWTKDQDGNDCVYTHGHWVNNRSLFPSQDVPEALATWQAYITVQQGLTVIMSGDLEPQCRECSDGMECFYFWTTFPMPSSTLSLAVGSWKECKKPEFQNQSANESIPYRVFGPETLMTKMNDIHRYIPLCLKEVTTVLGPHPMKRQDILVVPSSFDSLGMASPSVLYISQSLLHSDLSMFYRLAHEVCHTWFGIVIGPLDWTEEWLTEGFCTYLEDIVHTRVLKTAGMISEKEESDVRYLRDFVKLRTLTAEQQNTEESLQTLKPDCCELSTNKTFVKNGMNPEKKYLQVHYLKGYFLLRYLEKMAGSLEFLACLRKYVQKYHGKLVSSQEVLQFFIQECEEISAAEVTAPELSLVWLECSGIPSPLLQMMETESGIMSSFKRQVKEFCKSCKRKTTKFAQDTLKDFNPDELLLFLELLLDVKEIPLIALSCLKKKYNIDNCNAEIKHRWCELVIKCKQGNKFNKDIQGFLLDHQGMGVYLYGEMMLSGRRALIDLAHKCFQQLQHSMSTDNYNTVHSMLFGD